VCAARLRRLWGGGSAAINAWLTIPSSWTAEIVANAGFDAVTIDRQHGLFGERDCVHVLQAIGTTDAVPLARVRWNDPDEIMRVLDAGAQGIICPMVNTRAEAEAFVGACRYPPVGVRSYGPIRAGLRSPEAYFARANETIIALAMIETVESLGELPRILATPGLDGVYVGTVDLGISLGVANPFDPDGAELRKAIDEILKETKERRCIAGIHVGSPEKAMGRIREGFDLVTSMNDSVSLRRLAEATASASRRGAELSGRALP